MRRAVYHFRPRIGHWGGGIHFKPHHSDGTLRAAFERLWEKKLHDFLYHPAVQGGLIPFVVALITAELLQRLRLSGLAAVVAFAVTVYLVSGFSFAPLTTSRKLVLLGLASPFAAIALNLLNAAWMRPLLAGIAGASAIWMAERILQQQAPAAVFLWSAGCSLYVGWQVFWMDKLQDSPVRAGSAGMALGLGTGFAALFGASALLGIYGISLGAAAGAYLLIQMLTNRRLPCGPTFTLPLSLIAGLTGCLAVLTAELPWYALIALAAIPPAAKIPVSEKSALWLQSILLSAATLPCAAAAVYLTWRVAGAPPL